MAAKRRRKRDVIEGMDGQKLYRLSRIADEADLNLRTVQKHVRSGYLPVVRVGQYQRPRVTEAERQKYLGLVKKPGDDD